MTCICAVGLLAYSHNKPDKEVVYGPVIETIEVPNIEIIVSNNSSLPIINSTPGKTEDNNSEEVKLDEEAPVVDLSNYIDLTEDERELLARVVFLEAGGCSFECQLAVASVVINRLESGKWLWDTDGNKKQTIRDIIYYPNAFSVVKNIPYAEPTQLTYMAVDYVIELGPTLPPEVRYFRQGHDFRWKNYINYCVLDNLYFGYVSTWESGTY